jgi:hypothetical protein
MVAAYVGEQSVEAFLRRCGTLYPCGRKVAGRGMLWHRGEIDAALQAAMGIPTVEGEGDDVDLLPDPKGGPDTSRNDDSKVVSLPTTGRRRRET